MSCRMRHFSWMTRACARDVRDDGRRVGELREVRAAADLREALAIAQPAARR